MYVMFVCDTDTEKDQTVKLLQLMLLELPAKAY